MRIGLTGPIGSGKSLVASVWASLGAGIVEGDVMGRRALETDADMRRSLAERFGAGILNAEGLIDRSALAEAAFATAEGRAELTRLTFPTLYRLAQAEMGRLEQDGAQVVVFDAALIFEWGVERDFDRIVVVTAPKKLLIDRATQRLNISRGEAENRLRAQLSPAEKVRRADYVIFNNTNIEELTGRAKEVWGVVLRAENQEPRAKTKAPSAKSLVTTH